MFYLVGPKICDDRRTDCKHVLQYCSSLKGVCDKSCGHCGTFEFYDKDYRQNYVLLCLIGYKLHHLHKDSEWFI